MSRARIGVLGGTFDPVHLGHVGAARLVRRRLALDSVWLMPSHVPPHRPHQPRVSPFHRFAMTALASAGEPGLRASPLELEHPGPTYTADTLQRLHARGLAPWQIFFITGADAFAEIATWKQYPSVLDMAVFTVVARTTMSVETLMSRTPDLAPRWRRVGFGDEPVDDVTATSSLSVHPIVLIEDSLPDVSATEVRGRLERRESVHGLVPDLVEEYISRHRLYGDTSQGLA